MAPQNDAAAADDKNTAAHSSSKSHDMRVDPARAFTLLSNLARIRARIDGANTSGRPVRLIAVSKLKPASDILALHSPPATASSATSTSAHLDFGENYFQELQQKATALPRTVRWHFLGALQTGKCRPLAANIPNLASVTSVDVAKKADALEKGRAAAAAEAREYRDSVEEELGTLDVKVQVNTSGESEKSGCPPDEALALCRHVRENCPHLRLAGLMTIGALARSDAASAGSDNEDFEVLLRVREQVAQGLGIEKGALELSMGMSRDFEAAIRAGSDEVRVGSDIFGERPSKEEARIFSEMDGNEGQDVRT